MMSQTLYWSWEVCASKDKGRAAHEMQMPKLCQEMPKGLEHLERLEHGFLLSYTFQEESKYLNVEGESQM